MKIKINKEVISALKPCKERFDNYLKSYNNFNGDIQEFLDLANISHSDKLWVACRVIPRSILEVFSIDCAFSAAAHAAYAAAAYAAAYVATSTYVAANAYAAADAAATYVADAAYDAATYAAYAIKAAKAAADAAYVAAYAAANAATYVAAAADADAKAARKKEQENQIAVLKYLISEEK